MRCLRHESPLPRSRCAGGFTLIELIAAMALLSALGALLMKLVAGSFDLYEQGDARGDLYATAVPVIEMLEDDLLAVDSGPDGRLLLVTDAFGGSKGRGDGFFLRLIRTMPGGEQQHGVLRKAGSSASPEGVYAGEDPGPADRKTIAPPSGLMEVCWALVQDPRDPAGVLSLYRGTRAPVFAGGSFFADGVTEDVAWVRKSLKPMATGILGLWMMCESQQTEDWGELDILEGRRDGSGATLEWDSTRGLLDKDRFPLSVGPGSVADSRDDVYPRRVRIVIHVARGARPDAKLRRNVLADNTRMSVNSTAGFSALDEPAYIKVGDEWMKVLDYDGSEITIGRRRRGTDAVKAPHRVGDGVYIGRVFKKTLRLPAWRSYWREEER
ncbi:MAG: hypothetical protein CMJ83_13455 [Planctomycetes bacterium]|nr:hypothetical protein [Planctomycetota bacterium]